MANEGFEDFKVATEVETPAPEAPADQAPEGTPEGGEEAQDAGTPAPPAEPEWRQPVSEMFGGLAQELRGQIAELRKMMVSQYRQAQAQRTVPTSPREQTKHPYDDLDFWLEHKGDPKFKSWIEEQARAPMQEIQRLNQKLQEMEQRQARKETESRLYSHFTSESAAAVKEAQIPEKLVPAFEKYVFAELYGANADPFKANFKQMAKDFMGIFEEHYKSREAARTKAATEQAGKPATPGKGAATKPGNPIKGGGFDELRSMIENHYPKR
jgi:hypothetical protein